jgi:hypothetical protein
MTTFDTSLPLRRVLLADGVISGATGVLLATGAGPLEGLLAVPAPALRAAGLCLVPFALFVASLSRAGAPSRSRVGAVIALNAAWVAASVVVLLAGWIHPNPLGLAFVVGQAVAVAVLAEMQYGALRRAASLPA